MPTPYPFLSGATLLASQMNSLSQLPTVSISANSTAVATHAYSRIVANGSAITYTIPDSVFEAGQVIEFHNINSTACTIAAGAGVTLNGAAGLTVAQYQAATIYATSASSFILFESALTQTTPGLELISSTTIGSGVTSVNVPNAFSSTYDNYRIIVSGGAGSGNTGLDLTLGATATGYYKWAVYGSYSATTVSGANGNNAASWTDVGAATTNSIHSVFDLFLPNAAKRTSFIAAYGQTVTVGGPYFQGGFVDNATQYTDFTLTRNSGGVTITGGTIKVYGYKN